MALTGRAMMPTRALLDFPASIRPLLSAATNTTAQTPAFASRLPPTRNTIRTYYSHETPQPPPYPATESAILSAAFCHVPAHGFTKDALRAGARDAGYLDATTNLFPRGEYELVMWHLRTQRLGLRDRVQFADQGAEGLTAKVRALVLGRLAGNVDAQVVGRWQEALALMSLAGNIPPSLRELFLLSDEIWFLAGDVAVDSSWYTKRASLASIYAAAEVFQTTDQSSDYRDTAQFLDRRLDEARVLGGSWRNVKEWVAFQGMAGLNLARNLGVRI